MKTDVNINLSKLPAGVVDAAIEASGATTPRALVLDALKALAERGKVSKAPRKASAKRKPLTDAQLHHALDESIADEKAGRVKSFKTTASLMRWLES